MIPKIIHYCWYGKQEKPAVFEKCVSSWKAYLPEYEIMEWNDENTDLMQIPFLQAAYEKGQWAFVSDVVRCLKVYEYGGLYMDVDVEIISDRMGQVFQGSSAVFFFENNLHVATGLGFAAEKNHPVLEKIIEDYKQTSFNPQRLSDMICPKKNTEVLIKALPGFHANGETQNLEDIAFLSAQTYATMAKHYGSGSWLDQQQRELKRFAHRLITSEKILKSLRDTKRLAFFDQHRMRRIKKIYVFAVYDFVDYGPMYFVIKLWRKAMNKVKGLWDNK